MSESQAIHVVIFDGFADWEPAHALAEARRWGKRTVRSVGFTTAPVVSMGGLRVSPDIDLAAVQPANVELLLIPGGTLWEGADYPRAALEALLTKLIDGGTPVAAICAGTLLLARAGILDHRRHTSNGSRYLSASAPEYAGADLYVDEPAVNDDHVITASGLFAVEFAAAIFAELHILNGADRGLWFDMFKHGRLPPAATRV